MASFPTGPDSRYRRGFHFVLKYATKHKRPAVISWAFFFVRTRTGLQPVFSAQSAFRRHLFTCFQPRFHKPVEVRRWEQHRSVKLDEMPLLLGALSCLLAPAQAH
ncbi:hypothetical protein [Pseudomonas sp.]|uniref:hypothetical protein n=1 Tax=Pseudomonas sp. TaxID=306 RepID=UPI0026DCD0D3|nr:hypothetical protein [Pseudomonas sp.]MDO4236729.1 hypothetical protein [Pseudomonas sp.]